MAKDGLGDMAQNCVDNVKKEKANECTKNVKSH